ncbi:MAG: class I SAM-dependent methyltransferase [Methylacidiphilales bacterium]|nr:class I SAM-dependent methyltransferase [Candidatus Methylacidiphilales bacterium]
MDPNAIGKSYDQIAVKWQNEPIQSYGIAQLERAIRFVKSRGRALDIGCGSQGRMITLLQKESFQPEGLDISQQMIALAKQQHPGVMFHLADISEWNFPHSYDLIIAWDSIWHLPLNQQEPVFKKICANLAPDGVYLFTAVGFDEPGDHGDSGHMGVPLAYGTLGIPCLLDHVTKFDCACRHFEFDQFPEKHLCMIVQKH